MARKPTARAEYVMFNVYYEDGSQRSNRRVPADILGGIDGDEPARKLIEEQDREISGKSGMRPLRIERIVRVDDDVKQQARDTRRANEKRARASRRNGRGGRRAWMRCCRSSTCAECRPAISRRRLPRCWAKRRRTCHRP